MINTWTVQPIMKHYTNYAIPANQNGIHYVHYTEDTNLKKYKFLSLEALEVAYSRAYDIQEHKTFKKTVNFLARKFL
jgi:hypothetical protein